MDDIKEIADLPTLGVGMTFFPGIEDVIESNPELVNVIEVEPQTLWFPEESVSSIVFNHEAIRRISSFNCHKTIHSVDCPVGGSNSIDYSQLPLLARIAQELHAPWLSEHLSFNRANGKEGRFKTGFFLPPCQTQEGVEAAVNSIRSLTGFVKRPFAVENGVNYLMYREGDLTDGVFVKRVIEGANCGLILDLHNAWCNELNGRQKVLEFINEIPLERVLEVHLAGGFEDDGYWLDAHSNEISPDLLSLAHIIIPKLPNLRALIFEIDPSYVPIVGTSILSSQLKILHGLWNIYKQTKVKVADSEPDPSHMDICSKPNREPSISPSEWENVLGLLVLEREVIGDLATDLSRDPGIVIYRKIIESNRASVVAESFALTSRLLISTLGRNRFRKLISDFLKNTLPEHFALREGEKFVNYISSLDLAVPYLKDVVSLEKAFHAALIHNKTSRVIVSYNPAPILQSVVQFRKPDDFEAGRFDVEVGPDFIRSILAKGVN